MAVSLPIEEARIVGRVQGGNLAGLNSSQVLNLLGLDTSLIIADTQTALDGIQSQASSTIIVSPSANSLSGLVNIALLGKSTFSNPGGYTYLGHQAGVIGLAGHDSSATNPLMIGVEGKVEKLSADGVVEIAVGLEGQLSKNLSSEVGSKITTFIGVDAAVQGNGGPLTSFYGHATQVSGNTAAISNVYSHIVTNLAAGSGSIGVIIGFLFVRQTLNSATVIAFLNQDPDATIDTAGDLVFSLSSGGDTTVTPEDSASANTLTLPAVTGTVLTDQDNRLLQMDDTTFTTAHSFTDTIPFDGTTPQHSEGYVMDGASGRPDMTITMQAGSTNNKLEFTVELSMCAGATGELVVITLWNSTGDVIRSWPEYIFANFYKSYVFRHVMNAPSTSSETYTVNVGSQNGNTIYINQWNTSSQLLGTTTERSGITLKEIKA